MSRFDENRLTRIADWMQGYVDRRQLPGCSVLIKQGGDEVYYHDCGLRDVAGGKQFQRDTVARIYSMTKPLTSLALMMLSERGLLHLNAPVSDFIPAFAGMECLTDGGTEPCATPTLHQLLTHTSGLSYAFNEGPLPLMMAEQKIDFNPDRGPLVAMIDRLAALPLAFHPGTRWEYSVSIDVIGRVIEVVSGQSLAAFFEEHILGPLGMDTTRFTVPEGTQDRFAELYMPLPDGDSLHLIDSAETSPFIDTQMHSGGGGLVGTIDDYMTFCEALRTGGAGLVSSNTLAFMMRNHLPGDIASMGAASFAEQPMHGMGFGIGGAVVLDAARSRSIGSLGDFSWGGMASTFFWVDPVEDLSVVFFTQLLPSSTYPARPQLKSLVHGALM